MTGGPPIRLEPVDRAEVTIVVDNFVDLYAARHPEKVAAYVGSGQVGDGLAGEVASYTFALAEAQRRGKRRLVEKLRTIGPPPHSGKQVFAQRTVLAQLDGTIRPKALWRMYWPIVAAPESSILDLPHFMRGFAFSLDALWPEAFGLNLIELVPELQMPAFFFLGRNDHWVPAEVSVAYIKALNAPSKRSIFPGNHRVDRAARVGQRLAEKHGAT